MKSSQKLLLSMILIIIFIFTSYWIKELNYSKKNFDWKISSGTKIKVYLNQHLYSEAIIKSIPKFEELTGISVEYYVSPEVMFQDKVSYYLENIPSKIDVSMIGVHNLWRNSQKNLIENLDSYVENENITHQNYKFEDFHSKVLDTLRWNREENLEIKDSSIWAIPLGFELSAITYNKSIFQDLGLEPPKNLYELDNVVNKLKYNTEITPMGIRGIDRWNSLLFGYLTLFFNFGLTDFKMINDELVPNFNSSESIKFHKIWMNILRKSLAKDWEQNSWYKLSADIGARKVAMIFDSDLIGYSQNISKISKENGNLAIAPIPKFGREDAASGIWSWGLCINRSSNKKLASWLFIQYFTSQEFLIEAVKNYNYLSPARNSVLNSEEFSNKVSKEFKTHLLNELENSKILLTPEPYAIEVMNVWIETLHKIYKYEFETVEEGLDYLNEKVRIIISSDSKDVN